MKASAYRLLLIGGCLLALSGCSTPELALDPTLTTYSRERLEDMDEIVLPLNYNVDNFRKLQMGVAFEAVGGVDKKTGEPLAVSQDLSTRLQTEMAKLKRFTIYSAHNRGGVTFFEELADVDSATTLQKPDRTRDIDIVLSGRLTVTKERHDRYNDTLLIYEVECDFSCEDLKTRTVKFAEKAKGRTARKQVLSFSGMKMAGFTDEDEQQAITQAAMKALAVVANKLGNTFPVGGKITGVSASGERLQLDKGFDDGIGNRQQCVVFVNDGGVDVPLALAEASPGTDSSTLSAYRWNTDDPDAKVLIREYRDAPRQFLKNYKVYAVGYGLSTPPEWEEAYSGSMDEQLRLR